MDVVRPSLRPRDPRGRLAPLRRLALPWIRSLLLLPLLLGVARVGSAADLPDLIARSKPAIVGVGTFEATARPPTNLLGTGFAIGDGSLVITNAHVVDQAREDGDRANLVILTGKGRTGRAVPVEVVARDGVHDLAALRLPAGARLPALRLDRDDAVREGEAIAFIGFPIGAVLGLHRVTHTGIVSAITPIAIPAPSSGALSAAMIERLSNPFDVFQLDATAYPGNSGSPVLDVASGEVVAVINQVFVKDTKENLLKDPSGITYAMPARYVHELLESIER